MNCDLCTTSIDSPDDIVMLSYADDRYAHPGCVAPANGTPCTHAEPRNQDPNSGTSSSQLRQPATTTASRLPAPATSLNSPTRTSRDIPTPSTATPRRTRTPADVDAICWFAELNPAAVILDLAARLTPGEIALMRRTA